MNDLPLFTIITLTYDRFDLVRKSLEAMIDQTYKNLEIIIVNNGATLDITNYLTNIKKSDNRIKIIHFSENQFFYNDPLNIIKVCFNAALKEAKGDYVFYQSDDDLMSNDYVEKMVTLFKDNPQCTSAAGLVKDIDIEGRLFLDSFLNKEPRVANHRPRYMPGYLLALNTLSEDKYFPSIIFSAPGCIFTFKREELIKAGGYCKSVEWSHMYGIVPFGITGFDETAFFYWRRHKNQANLTHGPMTSGFLGLAEAIAFIKDWQIEKRWQIFGHDLAKYIVQKLLNNIYKQAAHWFAINLLHFRFNLCLKILKDGGGRSLTFWRMLPAAFWNNKIQILLFFRPYIRRMFELQPWLQKISLLAWLKEKAFKGPK